MAAAAAIPPQSSSVIVVNVVVLVVVAAGGSGVVVSELSARAILSPSPARRLRRCPAYSSYFLYAFVSASSTGPSISADLLEKVE